LSGSVKFTVETFVTVLIVTFEVSEITGANVSSSLPAEGSIVTADAFKVIVLFDEFTHTDTCTADVIGYE
jgi:hypothetical protein